MKPKLAASTAALLVGLFTAFAAAACPVCFGEAEAPILDGARLAIVFMGALTYLLITAAGVVVWLIRRKVLRDQKRTSDPRRGLKLVMEPSERI